VLRRIDGDQAHALDPPVSVGTSPEFIAAEVVLRLAGQQIAVVATFGDDGELFTLLDRGEVDLAVTSTTPPRRAFRAASIGAEHFALVAAQKRAPNRSLGSLEKLAPWITEQPWASYSLELPITRRFWQNVLGRPFPGPPRLVAPDLRAVLCAAELGVGVSFLPTFVCAESLAEGRMVEPYLVSDLVPEEPWFARSRVGDAARPAVKALLDKLAERPVTQVAAAVSRRHAGSRTRSLG